MIHFTKICDGIDVEPLREQIKAQPLLWDAHRERTGFKGSPFEGTSDQWLRCRAPGELKEAKSFREPHWCVNYPSWDALPAAQEIVFDLMRKVRAVHLGGVLLTRIPAGGRIAPHSDAGSWHAEAMTMKIYVPIVANSECVNYCGGESMVISEGEAVAFNNLIEIGAATGATNPWNGTIRNLRIWQSQLSNATLLSITR